MHSADDCRRDANECLLRAENACSDEDWHVFINLAWDWLNEAARLDGYSIADGHQITLLVRQRIKRTSKMRDPSVANWVPFFANDNTKDA